MIKPIKKKRLYEEIVKQLKDLINEGSLKLGDKLPNERDLSTQMNVSRTSMREALRSLEMMGFIESKVGEGTFIKEITIDNIIDPFSSILLKDKKLMLELIEVRLLLEVEIAKIAAKRVDSNEILDIENALNIMEKEIEEGEIGIEGDNTFHNALAKAAGNYAMYKMLNMCGDLLSSNRLATLKIPNQPQKSLEDHRKIFQAVKNGNEKEAAILMKQHLIKAQRNLRKINKTYEYDNF